MHTLQPRSAGELLDTSVAMARRHFLGYLRLTGPLYLVGLLCALISVDQVLPSLVMWLGYFVGLGIGGLAEARACLASRDLLEGRPFGVTATWRHLNYRWGAVVVGYTIKWLTVVVGLFVLILPAWYLAALYFGVPAISVFEDVGVRAARRRSRQLSQKRIGRFLLTIGLLDLGWLMLGLTFNILTAGEMFRNSGPGTTVLSWVVGLLILPVRSALMTLLYLDSRVRDEGYDLDRSLDTLLAGEDSR